tara:strand:- start:100 stop:441 length:342 start_codon:yes stop_codon:yes gene_type:complete
MATQRKIERQMIQAIVDERPHWQQGNTRVETYNGVTDVYLHGHKIASYERKLNGRLFLNNCGYETRTTKSRLNVLIDFVCGGINNGIFQKGWNWYLVKDGKQSYFPSGEWVAV